MNSVKLIWPDSAFLYSYIKLCQFSIHPAVHFQSTMRSIISSTSVAILENDSCSMSKILRSPRSDRAPTQCLFRSSFYKLNRSRRPRPTVLLFLSPLSSVTTVKTLNPFFAFLFSWCLIFGSYGSSSAVSWLSSFAGALFSPFLCVLDLCSWLSAIVFFFPTLREHINLIVD